MPDQPNILLIMCDDLGYGDVGFNGNQQIQTPHLDRLAEKSVRFTRFYAGGPVCSPTRGTCLTGRHYCRYGITHANKGRLPVEERTLSKVCQEAGYATGHFGKWHLGVLSVNEADGNRGGRDERLYSPPWLHGFDTCFSTESKVPTWDPMKVPDEAGPAGQRWGQPGTPFGTHYWNEKGEKVTDDLEGCDSKVIVDRAEKFIQSAVTEAKPFMATIWFHAPHTPVVAGSDWRGIYPDASEDEQHYFGCVSAMDAQVGRLAELLEELEIADNTIIWFCSDNGPEGGEDLLANGRSRGNTGGLRGRKRSLYEGGVGVPALLSWPEKLPAIPDFTKPCSTLDILPTCCAAIGIELPDDRPIDGENILPLIHNLETSRSRPIPYRFLSKRQSMFGAPTFALMVGPWKFLTNLDPEGQHDQLYNLEVDRGEEKNCIASHRKLQTEFREELEAFMDSCRRSHSGADYDHPVDMITAFQEERGWSS